MDARVHIFTATALGRGRVASPTLGRLYPEESPFYRRLSGPQDQSGHERANKNLHPSDTRDRTRAVQPVLKRLIIIVIMMIIIIITVIIIIIIITIIIIIIIIIITIIVKLTFYHFSILVN